jgi:hypothetical protein
MHVMVVMVVVVRDRLVHHAQHFEALTVFESSVG